MRRFVRVPREVYPGSLRTREDFDVRCAASTGP